MLLTGEGNEHRGKVRSVAWEELRVTESPATEFQHAVSYLGLELRRGEDGQERHKEMTSDDKQGLGRPPEPREACSKDREGTAEGDSGGHSTRMTKKIFPCGQSSWHVHRLTEVAMKALIDAGVKYMGGRGPQSPPWEASHLLPALSKGP